MTGYPEKMGFAVHFLKLDVLQFFPDLWDINPQDNIVSSGWPNLCPKFAAIIPGSVIKPTGDRTRWV